MKQQLIFTKDQIKRTANLLDNAGQVSLATLIIPSIIIKNQQADFGSIIVGAVITFGFWWGSLRLERISS